MSLRIEVRQMRDVTILDCIGQITLGEGVVILREKINDLITKKKKWIILNFAEVTYIDSTGINQLVCSYTTITNNGGWLKLLSLSKRVKDLLQITRFYIVFEIFEDENDAILSFYSIPF